MKNENDLEARLARTSTDHAAAADIAKAATDAHDKARAEYVANPTDAAGAVVLRTRDAAELANARLAHAQGIRDAAQADLDGYRATIEAARLEAEAEAARVARLAHLDELREKASIEAHRARIASAVLAIVEGEKAIRAGLAAIASSYGESNAAAAELRAEGEDVPKLDELHVLGPVLAARGSVRLDLNPLRYLAFDPSGPAKVLLSGFEVLEPKDAGTVAGHEERLRSDLSLRLSARTLAEGDDLVRVAEAVRAAQEAAERDREREASRVVDVDEDEDDGPSLLERVRLAGTAAAAFFTGEKASPELAS